MTDEDQRRLCQLYIDFNDGASATRAQSEAQIEQLFNENSRYLVFLSAQLLLREDDIPVSALFLSLVSIRRCFTPTEVLSREGIACQWLAVDAEERMTVKQAVFRGLLFATPAIVNQAALDLALLLGVEKAQMLEVIDKLFNLIEDDKYSLLTKAGAIMAIAEMCHENILGQAVGEPSVDAYLLAMCEKLRVWIDEVRTPGIPYELRVSLMRALGALVQIFPGAFHEQGIEEQLLIPVFQMLDSPVANQVLMRESGHLLFTFTKKLYDFRRFEFGLIGDRMVDFVKRYCDERATVAMQFWIDMAKEESRRQISSARFERFKVHWRKSSSYPIPVPPEAYVLSKRFRHYVEHACGELATRLLDFTLMINEEDTGAEDPRDGKIHMFANICLMKMFPLAPKLVFDAVKAFWQRAIEAGDITEMGWVQQHALILSVSTIQDRKARDMRVDNWLMSSFPPKGISILVFIASCITSPIPKVVDTALYTVSLCIPRISLMMSDDAVTTIISSMASVLVERIPPPAIVSRILMVVNAMIVKSQGLFMEKWFDSLVNFPLKAIDRLDAKETDIYELSYYVLSQAIFCSSLDMIDKIGSILDVTLSELENLSTDMGLQSFTIHQKKLEIVIACFCRFRDKFSAFGVRAGRLLFHILSRKNAFIWDEALRTLILIITSLKSSAGDLYDGNMMSQLIMAALESRSQVIICSTLRTLGRFYRNVIGNAAPEDVTGPAADLIEKLPATFDLISGIVTDVRYTRDFKPIALKSLAEVIQGTARYIQANEMRDRLLDLYVNASSELSVRHITNASDVEYANMMFAAIWQGFTALLSTAKRADSASDPFLRKDVVKSILIDAPRKFLELGEYTKSSLQRFCELMVNGIEIYDRYRYERNLIERRTNIILLVIARSYDLDDYELAMMAENALECLRFGPMSLRRPADQQTFTESAEMRMARYFQPL